MRAVRPLRQALGVLFVLLTSALWIAAPSGESSRAGVFEEQQKPPVLRRLEPGRRAPGARGVETIAPTVFDAQGNRQDNAPRRAPRERRMQRAGSFDGDLRAIPDRPVRRRERPERHGPRPAPAQLGTSSAAPDGSLDVPIAPLAAPSTSVSFDGLNYATWGAGHPPDTNGDVGPNHYIQSINSSLGIYGKTGGPPIAAFTLDAFMSQGNFGNLCDTDNFGDPVILYDTFEDRWVVTDFAFIVDGSGNVNPPIAFECFAVSKTGDPVAGGWNFYSVETEGGLGDYPKLGIWPDGLYMSLNMFDYAASGTFQNVRLVALNKAQMYAGADDIQIVEFDLPSGEFSLLPANARLQTGTPPPGAPNYFTSVWNYLNVVSVWKFQVDWNSIATSSLTGPFNTVTGSNWSELNSPFTVTSPGNSLDTLFPRLMMQNQYSNIGGVEALWNSHTVGASGATSSRASVRYYEVRVTGGAIAANATQAHTYSPADTLNRFMPSLAVDRAGNMAIGYSTSNSTTMPAIKYAGRLSADPVNSITQTETTLIQGAGTQSGSCGGTCERWGDYATMTLDPNGCTFWFTSEYYPVTGLNHHTRIGAFAYPSCSPIGPGSLQGSVKNASNVPIAGATVKLGSRTTTTDASGNYSFADLPAGTYPGADASFAGYTSASFASIVVNSGGTTVRNFVLTQSAVSGCITDTSQPDFLTGVFTNCDVSNTPGTVRLANPAAIDQQNLSVTNNGFGFNTSNWAGQTFTAGASGSLTRIDLFLFCSGCIGTIPNITVSLRATSGSPAVPSGSDLATATIPGFSSGSGGYFSAVFSAPINVTAGTRYAVIIRPVTNPSAGSYAYLCSCGSGNAGTNPYANGQRVISGNSGASWSADTASGGRDLGFVAFVQSGFASPGTFISSAKDANPGVGRSATWGTIAWNATTPAGTSVQFQVAASNSAYGPFTFVGPDGTSNTFFTNGGSLAQFNGRRYLKYKAMLTTSNSTVTPSLLDVTICFDNVYDDPTLTALLLSGGNRLQQLQNADGGWYFRATDTGCGLGPNVSCKNIVGVTALGLISAYQRSGDLAVLQDAVAAGELLKSIHAAAPAQPPFSQDLEFLVALSDATGDPQFATLATTWFGTITTAYPVAANRVTWAFDVRDDQSRRTLAVWDLSSTIRSAKAAGNISYASALANEVIAQEAIWKDINPAHRWDQCANATGCGPADNPAAFDYTLLGMGSLLWAIHDLPGFDSKIVEYRSWLLSQQDPEGSWDVGDLQITSYAAMGLGAVGGTGTNAAIQSAVSFFLEHQLPSGGWPFAVINGVSGGEYAMVDSEVMRAIAVLYGTQPGESVTVAPSQLGTVTFTQVTSPGETTMVAQAATGAVPSGYAIVEGLTYQIATTAEIAGASTVCFRPSVTSRLTDVRILHKEGDAFVDRTSPVQASASGMTCATADSLDTFAIAQFDASALDTEAPVLNVTLSHSTLSPPNNRMIAVTATIAASDNSGEAPAISLVSIVAGGDERGKKDAIAGASLGSDDRSFELRAQKGRVYTIVYRATDASGNSTEVVRQVTVP